MAVSYVVDTSVITRLANAGVRSRLEQLDAGGLARVSITDLEIGFSARNADEWDRLQASLAVFRRLDIEEGHFRRAAALQRSLAAAGLRGRKVPDLVIAAVAESSGHTVLHYDADFDHIADMSGLEAEWVVPRGTIP